MTTRQDSAPVARPYPADLNPDLSIAVIGMSCRFPGAPDVETFWQNLRQGVESISFFSDDELLAAGIHPGLLHHPNYVKAGAVLSDVELFDAEFFGFSPREARIMDPQQRLFLESAWAAIESAGIDPVRYGGAIGVYAGVGLNTYLFNRLYPNRDLLESIGGYRVMLVNDKDFVPTRVSYKLNLTGPSISVQSACSTSLVATHLACQSLLSGECDVALAGGATIRVPQKTGYLYQDGMIFSPDGHCRAFDAKARGTVSGSGVGIVVLKRLSDAIADRDSIQAIIRGSAVNNDGAIKVDYTAPSVDGQTAVVVEALAMAEVEADTIGYVETHGTGTAIGDPIEIAALTRAFRAGTSRTGFCAIGSVKTNLGHLDTAAGVAGLIKTVLALKHKQIPPSLHFERPNPEIDFANSPFYVSTALSDWEASGVARRAGVSAFGIGGTNAHVVLEEAPEPAPKRSVEERPWHILPLSARDDPALRELAQRYVDLGRRPGAMEDLAEIGYSAATGRTHFNHRLALVAPSSPAMSEQLAAFVAGRTGAGLATGHVTGQRGPAIAFLFTGQGAQHVGMGQGLYETQPTFRETLDRCDELLRPHLDRSLLSVLYPSSPDDSPIDQTVYTQPALFALQVALAELWRAWGVEPMAVLGHSVGELAAACVAGVMSVSDGLQLVAARGQLMQDLPTGGGMAAVFAGEDKVRPLLVSYEGHVSLAALNGPESVVISGPWEMVTEIISELESGGIRTRKLNVSHAFHSPLMEPMMGAFEQVARHVQYARPRIKFVSSLHGRLASDEIATPAYWVDQVRQPVRFSAAMQALGESDVFLEIGPQPVLLGMGRWSLPESGARWLPSLQAGQSDWQQMLQSLAALYVHGTPVDWQGFDRDYERRRVGLPGYPFQRQRYWVELPASNIHNGQAQNPTFLDAVPSPTLSRTETSGPRGANPLLGTRLVLPMSSEIRFESRLSPQSPAHLQDHQIGDRVVVPAVGYVAMVLAAVEQALGGDTCVIEELVCPQALVLSEGASRAIQLILAPQGSDYTFQVVSLPDDRDQLDPAAWVQHVTGRVRVTVADGRLPTEPAALDRVAVRTRCPEEVEPSEFYARLLEAGYNAGPAFRWIGSLWRGEGEALARLDLAQLPDDAGDYRLHPGLLDSCTQVLSACGLAEDKDFSYLPFRIGEFRFHREAPSEPLWCYARLHGKSDESLTGDILLVDSNDRAVAEFVGYESRRTSVNALGAGQDDWLYSVTWLVPPPERDSPPSGVENPGSWLLLADQGGLATALAEQLRRQGDHCALISVNTDDTAGPSQDYSVNPRDPHDMGRVLAQVGPGVTGIVHLWSLDAGVGQGDGIAALQSAQEMGAGSVLRLVQALARAGWTELPDLWLVTRGAQPITTSLSPPELAQTALWGLSRTIATEHPELHCRCVDLDPAGGPQEVNHLLKELRAGGRESQVAFRARDRLVPRLARHRASRQRPIPIRKDGAYLITGGLGGLGLLTAGWLVGRGVRHLVLVGRSGVDDRTRESLRRLEQSGAQVLVAQTDASDEKAVIALFERLQREMPELRGIVHAAGVLDDGLLIQQDWGRFARVLRPKVEGAWNLHRQSLGLPLDFFILYSSVVSWLGFAAQGNYAAANAFLDGLAHYRRTLGLPGLSVNWGTWEGLGMTADLDRHSRRRLADSGIGTIAPEQGARLLDRLLEVDTAQVGVLPVDWGRFIRQFQGNLTPFFEHFALREGQNAGRASKIFAQLVSAPHSERRPLLTEHVRSEIVWVLGLDSPQQVTPRRRLFDLGLDSLLALELRSRLETSLERPLGATLVFDYPTLEALVDYLIREILPEFFPEAVGAEPVTERGEPADLDHISEAEIARLLADEIEAARKRKPR